MTQLYRVSQSFDSKKLQNVERSITGQFSRLELSPRTQAGGSVAVAVGSRAMDRLVPIVRTVIACLRNSGLKPFVVPAMGSHGGAIASGQVQVLKKLGITQASVGAPIVSSMEVVRLGSIFPGADVFLGKDLAEADHIVVINRVKPHTAFRGPVESGLCKMLSVGCGKQKGASNMHASGLEKTIVPAAEMILARGSVLLGVATVENAFGKTHTLQLAPSDMFVQTDANLLRKAWQLFPKLPVDDLDILAVQEMGKDISGTGMDPNVVGNWRRFGGPREPDFRTIIVLQLTSRSQGNGTGIGMADLTTRRMLGQIDWKATYRNALTSGIYRSALKPIALAHDKEAFSTALSNIPNHEIVRLALIRNTKALDVFWATAQVIRDLADVPGFSISNKPRPLSFNRNGYLIPLE